MSAGEIEREQRLSAEARDHAKALLSIADELGIELHAYSFTGDIPVSSWSVFDRDGWECRRCGSHRALTVDHIVSRVTGGTSDPSNLQMLCASCNSGKGAR